MFLLEFCLLLWRLQSFLLDKNMAKIYDRKKGVFYEDKQYGGNALKFLYGNVLGRIILKCFVVRKFYSEYNAKKNRSPRSIKKIAPFVEEYGITLDDFENKEYSSFSDFFTRKLVPGKREFSLSDKDFIAVADSKLLCYEITDSGKIPIKNSIYTAKEIVNEEIDSEFYGGYCLVFRLTVDDYHRYCFFDDGKVQRTKYVPGKLHTVSPISSKMYKVFSENCRSVSYLATEHFGVAPPWRISITVKTVPLKRTVKSTNTLLSLTVCCTPYSPPESCS